MKDIEKKVKEFREKKEELEKLIIEASREIENKIYDDELFDNDMGKYADQALDELYEMLVEEVSIDEMEYLAYAYRSRLEDAE